MSIKSDMIQTINGQILQFLQSKGYAGTEIISEIPPNREMGDVAYPMFKYAGVLKMKPFDIAAQLKEVLSALDIIENAEVKGPYLNLFFRKKAVAAKVLSSIAAQGKDFGRKPKKNKKVLIEFSCPNTNKPLHLGHCRNNVLGDCAARLFEFNGYEVNKVNLINDRGIHICKSMLAYQRFGNGTTPEKEGKKSDHLVGDFYVRYAKESDKNPDLEKEAQNMLRLWENNDPKIVELWKLMNKWAIDGIKQTYERMGITFDHFEFESIIYIYGKEIILEGMKNGVFYKEADGSVWINNEDIGLDKKAVLRSDGTSIYITQDIGTAVHRQQKFGFDRMIYVVASEQNYHFKTLFAILKKLGHQWADQCYHLSYGMVNLPEGKMKSREGNVVDADNLLDLLYEMAMEAVNEKKIIEDEEGKKETASRVSLAALKYYLLNFSTIKDITFSPEKSISFDGNTGPYLQYTTARIYSLLRKAGSYEKTLSEYSLLSDEWNLSAMLLDFEDVVEKACENVSPVDLTTYLYELCRLYNKYYHDVPINVEDPAEKNARLFLSQSVLTVLVNGMKLLGIEPLERM